MQTRTDTATQGIMTDEVGAITGDVVITTEEQEHGIKVTVAYTGARDTYTVTGSPAQLGTAHDQIIKMLTRETDKATTISM